MRFIPDGTLLATSDGSQLYLWDTKTQSLRGQVEFNSVSTLDVMSFSPDSKRLVAGKLNYLFNYIYPVQLWDIKSQTEQTFFPKRGQEIFSVGFNGQDATFATLCPDKENTTLCLKNVPSGSVVLTTKDFPVYTEMPSVFSRDGHLFAAVNLKQQVIEIWNTISKELQQTIPANPSRLAFNAKGNLLAGYSSDELWIWDSTTGQQLIQSSVHSNFSGTSLVFSPNDEFIAITGYTEQAPPNCQSFYPDCQVVILSAVSGKHISTLQSGRAFTSISFSSDGSIVAFINDDWIRVLDVLTGKELTMLYHRNIAAVVFSPDGTLLASISDDGDTRMWGVVEK